MVNGLYSRHVPPVRIIACVSDATQNPPHWIGISTRHCTTQPTIRTEHQHCCPRLARKTGSERRPGRAGLRRWCGQRRGLVPPARPARPPGPAHNSVILLSRASARRFRDPLRFVRLALIVNSHMINLSAWRVGRIEAPFAPWVFPLGWAASRTPPSSRLAAAPDYSAAVQTLQHKPRIPPSVQFSRDQRTSDQQLCDYCHGSRRSDWVRCCASMKGRQSTERKI